MKPITFSFLSAFILSIVLYQGCSNNSGPTSPAPTATPTSSPTKTATTSSTPTITFTPTITATFTITATPTITSTPTVTASPTFTSTSTPNVTPVETVLTEPYMESLKYANGHLYGLYYTGTLYRFTDSGTNLSPDFSAVLPGGNYAVMAVTASGGSVTLFAADETDKLIQVYTDTGSAFAAVTNFGGGTYFAPRGVGLDGSGNLYISDLNNGAFQIDPYQYNFSTNVATAGTPVGTTGVGLSNPGCIAYDGSATFYVGAMSSIAPAQVYTYTGNPLSEAISFGASGGLSDSNDEIAVDPVSGNVFVVDASSNDIEKFSPNGTLLYSFAPPDIPLSLAFDGSGHLYYSSLNFVRKINTP